MKIYFAGSIRGGRDDHAIYFQIIQILKEYGEVLTEHVGDKNVSSVGESNKRPEFIFQRDIDWIKESDLIVAEVSNPSLGVGYEIGLAECLDKKIIALYRDGTKNSLSAMILGNPNVEVFKYNKTSNLEKIIGKIFEKL